MSLKDFQTMMVPSDKLGKVHFYHKPTKTVLEADYSQPNIGGASANMVFRGGNLLELPENGVSWSVPFAGGCPKILFRPQKENLLAGSNDPTVLPGNGMNWESIVALDVQTGISVFGTNDGFELKPTTVNSEHKLNIDSNDLFTVGVEHTWLFFIETNGIENIGFNSSVGFPRFNLNLGLETFTNTTAGFNSGTIENLGNNKYKVKVKFTPATIGGAALIYLKTTPGGSFSETFLGDGVSSVKFSHVTICLGDEDLPIPNPNTNTISRSKNLITFSNLLTKGVLNSTQGSLIIKLDTPQAVRLSGNSLFTLGASPNAISLRRVNNDPLRPRLYFEDASGSHRFVIPDDVSAIAISWREGELSVSCNGVTLVPDSTSSGLLLDLSTNNNLVVDGAPMDFELHAIALSPIYINQDELNVATASL